MLRGRSLFMDNLVSSLNRMPKDGRSLVRDGALFTGLLTGTIAYFQYRMYVQKVFQRSEGHYRMGGEINNCTPWKQMYFTWWRMPFEEWKI